MDATPLEKMGFGEGATEKAQKAFANDRDGVKNSELCSALVASFFAAEHSGLMPALGSCVPALCAQPEGEFVSGMHITERPIPATSRRGGH